MKQSLGLIILLGCLLVLLNGGRAMAQGGRPLVDNYSIKAGVSYSESFIMVTRKSDQSEARLVSDSEYSPHLSLATPPLFLADTGLAFGISVSYAEFEASQQEFPDQGPASIGSSATGRMAILTPAISYYLGRTSSSQFLRISLGAGWAYAKISGQVQFGDTPGAESSETLENPEGVSSAILFALEYRAGPISLALMGGGPKIESKDHIITMGENSLVAAWVFNF